MRCFCWMVQFGHSIQNLIHFLTNVLNFHFRFLALFFNFICESCPDNKVIQQKWLFLIVLGQNIDKLVQQYRPTEHALNLFVLMCCSSELCTFWATFPRITGSISVTRTWMLSATRSCYLCSSIRLQSWGKILKRQNRYWFFFFQWYHTSGHLV